METMGTDTPKIDDENDDFTNYELFNAIMLLDEIDSRFNTAKAKGLSRLSPEWGKWSRAMNLVLRKHSQDGETLSADIFSYWVIMSQVLELYCRSSIFGGVRKKQKLKVANQLRLKIMRAFRESTRP
ncbi:MAG: hypothetical protein RBT11_19840 [Desulfobacterales bacterium]|nr:hypothetical protein [Desulfobacterales bacterium]